MTQRTVLGRKHSFSVILPQRLKIHSETELNLMRISLLNAIVAANVHLSRIDHELKARGTTPFTLHPPLSNSEMRDIIDVEHRIRHFPQNYISTEQART